MDGIHEGETDGTRLARMGTDAVTWAGEFVAMARAVAKRDRMTAAAVALDPAPGNFLHGWLCAAIEAGRSAGYSQGRQDAIATGERWAARRGQAADSLDGRLLRAVLAAMAWPLPEDPAGRGQPEDPAARDLPADLAGRDIDTYADAKARFEDAWRKHAAEGPHVILGQHDAAEEPSPIARAADALERIAQSIAEQTATLRRGDRGRQL